MTYNQACELDPRIRTIERSIRNAYYYIPRKLNEQDWAAVYKPMILRCVGWDAEVDELKSSVVYEMVYTRLRAIFAGGKG